MTWALCLGIAYLVGSIPTGLLLARSAGIDIRTRGSGNIGATNLARTMGSRIGLLTLVLDVLKGFTPTLLANHLGPEGWLAPLTALSAVLGHLFPVFAQFRGGKGVATAAGGFIVLAPAALGVVVMIFAVIVAVTRFVSLASILGGLCLPVAAFFFGQPDSVVVTASLVALTFLFTHRENLFRLRTGTEPRLPSQDRS